MCFRQSFYSGDNWYFFFEYFWGTKDKTSEDIFGKFGKVSMFWATDNFFEDILGQRDILESISILKCDNIFVN